MTTHPRSHVRVRTLLAPLVRVEEEEVAPLLLSFAYFFSLLGGYYILQPLRDALGLAGGVRQLWWLFLASLGVMAVASSLFSAAVARLERRRFIPLVYGVSAAALLVFWGLLRSADESWMPALGRVFFLFVGVYNLFIVSVFWGFMADLWRGEQGKRLFGFVGAGGTLGQILGSALTARLAGVVDPVDLLLVTVALLLAAIACVRRLVPRAGTWRRGPAGSGDEGVSVGEDGDAGRERGAGFLDGMRTLVASPYLIGICLYLFLYTFTSSFLWFEKMAIVADSFSGRVARTAFFAEVNTWVGLLTVTVQLFLTGRVLSWLGVARALALVPLLTAAGFVALGLHPVLAVYVAFEVSRKSLNYSIARPAREILYTVVGRAEKYQAKSFIDTFVYRGGDAVAATAFKGLQLLQLGLAGIAWTAVPVSLLWMATGLWLGGWQQTMAARADGD